MDDGSSLLSETCQPVTDRWCPHHDEQVVRDIVALWQDAGDNNIYLIEGPALLNNIDIDVGVDYTDIIHPVDSTFFTLAENLKAELDILLAIGMSTTIHTIVWMSDSGRMNAVKKNHRLK